MGLPQYKPSNQLTNHNPIHALTVARKSLRKAKSVVIDKNSLDNPLKPSLGTLSYLKIYSNMFLYRRKNRISVEGMELLVYAYLVFMESSEGVSSLRACRDFNKVAKSELQSMRNKLNTLEGKGYLVKLCKTERGAYLYIPSVKAIEDIENIFK